MKKAPSDDDGSDDEDDEMGDESVICLTPTKPRSKVHTQKFRLTDKQAAYQIMVWAEETTNKRINDEASYKWNIIKIRKQKKGSAKSYDFDLSLRLLPKLQLALEKINSANKGLF